MIAAEIFHRLNGTAPLRIESEEMKGGTSNLGILLHKAQYPSDAAPRFSRIVEKKSALRKDRRTARMLLERQRLTRDTAGLPRIYRLARQGEVFSVFMEYLDNVDDPGLREPAAAAAIAAALWRINGITLPKLAVPDPASLFEGRVQRMRDWFAVAAHSTDMIDGLDAVIAHARQALPKVPVYICHLDLGFANMALNPRSGRVRLVDFGLLGHDFAGADFSSLYRVRLRSGFDLDPVIAAYCDLSGLPPRDVWLSLLFAAAKRSAFGMRQSARMQDDKRMVLEKRMLAQLVTEYGERFAV